MTPPRTSPDQLNAWLAQLPAPDAVAAIVTAFEPLVQTLAARYWQPVPSAEIQDLEQVARIGLVIACQSFDRAKGAFPTHATWCMRHELAQHVTTLQNPVRIPMHIARGLPKLRRLVVQLSHDLQRRPTLDELAAAMRVSTTTIRVMLVHDWGGASLNAERARDQSLHARKTAWIEDFPSTAPTPEDILIAKEINYGHGRQ